MHVGGTGEKARPAWRGRAVWAAALVVVLAVVVAGVVIHNIRKDRLDAGAVRSENAAISGPAISSSAQFQVPNAALVVQATAGRAARFDDDGRIRAPRGGVLVRVAWSSTRSAAPTAEGLGDAPSTLAVRSRGRTVTVDPRIVGTAGEQQAVVALLGDADDVVLEVRFAGRGQAVELLSGRRHAGSFASLYTNGAWPFGPKPALSFQQKQPADPASSISWNAEVRDHDAFRVPYLAGLGWAPRGREWFVVRSVGYYLNDDAALWKSGGRRAQYAVQGASRFAVTVAGKAPAKVLRKPGESGKAYGYSAPRGGEYVFSIRSGDRATVESALSATLRRSSGDRAAPRVVALKVQRRDVHPAVAGSAGEGR